MNPSKPSSKRDLGSKQPKWSSPLWFLPLMLLMLWVWQSTLSQFSYRTISYSEFKNHVAHQEVTKCVVRQDDIQGEIGPKSFPGAATTGNTNAPNRAAANDNKPYLFRTVRVEDPNLVQDLENAGVDFRGERP